MLSSALQASPKWGEVDMFQLKLSKKSVFFKLWNFRYYRNYPRL